MILVKKSKILGYLLIILFVIRLTFFYSLNSYELDNIFKIIIFIISILFLILIIFLNKDYFIYLYKNNKSYFLIMFYLLFLELSLNFKNNYHFSYIYFFNILLSSFLFLFISFLIPQKIMNILNIFLIIFYCIYFFAQDVYFKVFEDYFSLTEATSLGGGVEFGEDMIKFSFYRIIIILLGIITLIFYIKLSKFDFKNDLKTYKILLVLFFLFNITANYSYNYSRIYQSDHYLYYSNYSHPRFVNKYGIRNYLVRDLTGIIIPNGSKNYYIKKIDNYYNDIEEVHEDNEYSKIFEDKNLIFILAESFDRLALHEDLTPNILRLKNEGLDFSNHYSVVYPRTTSDTEFIINTGLIPSIADGPTCFIYNDNSYKNSLANLFKNKGYTTNFFHANTLKFYKRNKVYKGYGYDNLYGKENLIISENIRFDSLFYKSVKSNDYYKNNDKFFNLVLSLAGHSPYLESNVASKKHYAEVKKIYPNEDDYIINYIASQVEVDKMVEEVFKDLEEKNILDDTVLVFMNDHYPYTLDDNIYENFTNIYDEHEKQRGSLFIWSNDLKHQEINTLTSSFDVLPILANMFNLDLEYKYLIGNDLNVEERYVYFKDYYVLNNNMEYISLSDNNKNNDEIKNIIKKNYYLNKIMIRSNYFKK